MSPAQFIDNPEWESFLPEERDAPRARSLPTHEDCSPLDPEKVAEHLHAGGTLGAMPGYEERPGQVDMLKSIVRAFNAREHLMVEASTGVGKSLAYLLPAVHWARVNDTAVVVSTATRNLQGQLMTSDIPRALRTLGDGADGFRVALLKGRGNYLGLRAVGEFFAAGFWTMSEAEKAEMPHFIDWLTHTPDGDLDGYEGLPRALLSCPGEECGGRRCHYRSRCFLYRARKAAAEAHLVVVNHSLVLAEASGGGGLLPAYGRLVLDEAHDLEDIATDYFSREFSMPALMRILNRLFRRGRGRRTTPGGVLASVDRQLAKGALSESSVAEAVRGHLMHASTQTVRVTTAAEALADFVAQLLHPRPGRHEDRVRYRVAGGRRAHSLHGLFEDYGEDEWQEARLLETQDAFEQELATMVNILHDLADTLDDATPPGEMNFFADLTVQVRGVAQSMIDFANATNFVLCGEKETHAYWIERVRPTGRPAYVRLVAAPLSVAEDLGKCLYGAKDSVVLCSATLRVGKDFKYMSRRLGAVERFSYLVAASPFDYLRQALVLAPDCLPDPSADGARYAADLASVMGRLFAVSRGRALVLFTSYEMMNAVAACARPAFAAAGLRLLVQGEGLSRETMTAELKAAGVDAPTVIFGSQSFWEGVDVAGASLSCVVIARLPFAQIGDPVTEARGEKIEREGGSAFRDYSLPEAVIKFRQGFGRLIRSRRDRGVVVVADPRIVTKNYGGAFRKSIPASVHTVTDVDDLLARAAGFFADEA